MPRTRALAAARGPALVVAATIATRLWATRHRRTFVIWPDEPAQLGFARLVSGGARWNMNDHSTWRPGYGLLLGAVSSPAHDPHTIYRVAMVLNALLAGAAALVLYLVARRLTRLTPAGAALATAIAMLLPSSVFIGNFAWSEPLTVLALLATVLALIRFEERPSAIRGVVAVAAPTIGFSSHTRLLLLLAVVAGFAVAAAIRRRLPPAQLAAVLGAALGGFAGVELLSRWTVGLIWDEPFERNSFGGLLDQVGHLPQALVAAVGQVWYLVVTTGGLAAVGVVALAAAARRGERAGPARVVVVVVVSQLALSALFMAERWRPDHVVYGRYDDAFVGILVVAGLAAAASRLGSAWSARAVVAVTAVAVASAVVIVARRGDQLEQTGVVDPMVLGLTAFGDRPMIGVARITAIAVAVTAALGLAAAAARGRAHAVPLVVIAVLLGWGGFVTDRVMEAGWSRGRHEDEIAQLEPRLHGTSVDYYLAPGSTSTQRMMRFQWLLPDTRFEVVATLARAAGDGPIFANRDTPELLGAGYTVVWRDPGSNLGLWVRR